MQPSSPTNYPRQYLKPTGVDFSVLGEGFQLFWGQKWLFMLGGVMLLVPIAILGGLSFLVAFQMGYFETTEADFAQMMVEQPFFQGGYMLVSLVGYALMGPTYYGLSAITMKLLRRQPVDTDDLMLGWRRPGAPMLLSVLTMLAVMLGSFCCYFPAFIFGGLFMLAFPFMVDEQLGPVASLRASLDVVKDHWLIAAAFYFVASLLQGLGALACVVGILATMPMFMIWVTLIYRDLHQRSTLQPHLQPDVTVPPQGPGFGR